MSKACSRVAATLLTASEKSWVKRFEGPVLLLRREARKFDMLLLPAPLLAVVMFLLLFVCLSVL